MTNSSENEPKSDSDSELDERLRYNAADLFKFLGQETDYDPEGPLEWVFAIISTIELTDEHHAARYFEAFDDIVDSDHGDLSGEIYAVDGHDYPYQFLMIFNGVISESELHALHERFAILASSMDAEYTGVEVDDVGEMDEAAVAEFIAWTDSVLDQAGDWKVEQIADVAKSMRDRHVAEFQKKGLEVADWMPTAESRGLIHLRPKEEIVKRLMAAFATVAWVSAPEEVLSEKEVREYLKRNQLVSWLSDKENQWVEMTRDEARQFDLQAGWITENLWALAWLLGNAPTVSPAEQMVPPSILVSIREDFMARLDKDFDELMEDSSLMPLETIITLEDFLYCAHNGCRNLGDEHKIGVIQERRQALTWALSPGVRWDDTDVST